MAKSYRFISLQQVQKHIDNVKREIENTKLSRSELKLNLESGYTGELITQTERYYRHLEESQSRLSVLKKLLDELETRVLPAALEGEKNRMINDRENHVKALESQIEILHRRNEQRPEAFERLELKLSEARARLQEANGA